MKPGDHVVPLYTAECGECKFCKVMKNSRTSELRCRAGKQICAVRFELLKVKGRCLMVQLVSAPVDKIFFITWEHPLSLNTLVFSNHSIILLTKVVADVSIVAVNPKAPLDKVCLLGCGITTGFGAATRTAKVEKGSVCAIFGCGCVGLSVIQGCVANKAGRIIAIDTNDGKESWARKFGATDFVNPTKLDKPVQEYLVDITDGGCDYTFDCTGNVGVMRAALEACHKGWGQSIIIGVAAAGQEIKTRPFQLVTGRVWRGSAFGGVKGRSELPTLVEDYLKGTLKVDDFVTHRKTLGEINDAFEVMHHGDCIRAVCPFLVFR